MDWSTTNPSISLVRDDSHSKNWLVDYADSNGVKRAGQNEGEKDRASSKEMQGAVATHTRGAAVINDVNPETIDGIAGRGEPEPSKSAQKPTDSSAATKSPGLTDLTPEEKKQVEELKKQDASVRRHEQAHVMAGGRYIKSRAQFQYELGPDGKLYAVSGEVQIDTSEVPDDPGATIQKAQTVRRAALAPSDPSAQDRRVASEANRMEFEARMELAQQRAEELRPAENSSRETQTSQVSSQPSLLDLFV
jgi:hypothetical protein